MGADIFLARGGDSRRGEGLGRLPDMFGGARVPLVDLRALFRKDPGVMGCGRAIDGEGGREKDFSVDDGEPPRLPPARLGFGLTVRGRSIIASRNLGVPLPTEAGES